MVTARTWCRVDLGGGTLDIWPLGLRLILFWEFWEAGISKYRGENWFADIPWADWQKGFPWPFDLLGPDLNWLAATWSEMVFAVLLGAASLCRQLAQIP